jgi:Protein of unknown function DUF917, C-terminal
VAPLLSDEEEHISDTPRATASPQSRLLISFQNENLTAELFENDSSSETSKMLAVVPDLITVLDAQSGASLGTHEYRYGVSASAHGVYHIDTLTFAFVASCDGVGLGGSPSMGHPRGTQEWGSEGIWVRISLELASTFSCHTV